MAGVGRSTGLSRSAASSMSSSPTIDFKLGSLVEQYGLVLSTVTRSPWAPLGPSAGRQVNDVPFGSWRSSASAPLPWPAGEKGECWRWR